MATLTVLCPGGRRCNVKATPNTILLQVLEQVCSKQNLDPNCHALKHHKSLLDLSTAFRYSNLSNFAKLELVKTDRPRTEGGEVVIAVQREEGARVQGNFPPGLSLWEVLTQLDVVGRNKEAGPAEGVEPVVAYMAHQVCGEGALREKTLRQLGLSTGRAVIRLYFRPAVGTTTGKETSQQPVTSKEEDPTPVTSPKVVSNPRKPDSPAGTQGTESGETGASTQPEPQPPQEEVSDVAMDTSSGEAVREKVRSGDGEELPYFPTLPFNYFPLDVEPAVAERLQATTEPHPQPEGMSLEERIPQQLENYEPVHVDSQPPQPKPHPQLPRVYDEPCDREMVVYRRDEQLLVEAEDVPDKFFDVTMKDVQMMHEDLKKQVKMAQDTSLTTSAMKQLQKERSKAHYPKAIVRVFFPDLWVLQASFRPRESLKALVQFIRENLAEPETKFHLYTTPPKQVLKSGKITFIEAGFVPAAIVHLSTESKCWPLLSDGCLSHAQSPIQAELVQARERGAEGMPQGSSANKTDPGGPEAQAKGASSAPPTSSPSAPPTTKVPKWFKMGK